MSQENTLYTRIQQLVDVPDDATLFKGEIAIEQKNNTYSRIKVGDGKHELSELPYANELKIDNLDDEGGRALKYNGELINIIDVIYPVGSIYMSFNNTNPGSLFGGIWEHLPSGFVLMDSDTEDDVTPVDNKTTPSEKYKVEGNSTVTLGAANIPKIEITSGSHEHDLSINASGLPNHRHHFNTNNDGAHQHITTVKTRKMDIGTKDVKVLIPTDGSGDDTSLYTGENQGIHMHGGVTVGPAPLEGLSVESLDHTHTGKTKYDGAHTHVIGSEENTAISIIQPSLKCHMWRRTA